MAAIFQNLNNIFNIYNRKSYEDPHSKCFIDTKVEWFTRKTMVSIMKVKKKCSPH